MQPKHQESITHIIRQRSISNNYGISKKLQTSYDTMERLQLENCFDEHNGCVNCLEWNKSGKLLASGSDDHSIIIYDPFVRSSKNHDHIRQIINTDHEGNIFSLKFMPDSGDTLMATCGGDNQVKLINILSGENYMNCKHCHQDRVKRVAVHHREPNLIWSAGEDGYIMEFDIREGHNCSQSRPKNLILDLKTASQTSPIAKCLAINPIRDEMIAVGSTDSYIRLFDRRCIKKDAWQSCTAYFTPGQNLLKTQSNDKKATRQHQSHSQSQSSSYPFPVTSYGTTYVAFSPNGSELLANIHADHIYLFSTYEPLESFKTFEHTLEPLILDLQKQQTNYNNKTIGNIKPVTHWKKLREYDKRTDIPTEHFEFYKEMMKKCRTKEVLRKEEFDKINLILSKIIYCPELYHLRAACLIQRAWLGDYYQAIRDSCDCIALNPFDCISYENLAYSAYYLQDKNLASSLLVMIELIKKEKFYELKDNLEEAIKVLQSLLRDSPTGSPLIWSSSGSRAQFQSINQLFEGRYGRVLVDFEDFRSLTYETNSIQTQIQRNENSQDNLKLTRNEMKRVSNAFDYNKRFCGHCNLNTDIKEANFFGHNGEFVVGGSDDGAFYIWDKKTTNIVKAVVGDQQILNCIQPHPSICMLATSGIESTVKIWSPIGIINRDVKCLELRCKQNQDYITSDPLEAMIMMLYPNRDNEHSEN